MLFSSDHNESLLYLYFHEYYSEVVHAKELIQQGSIMPGEPGSQAVSRVSPLLLHQRFLPILERQRMDAAHRGGEYGATLYREAQYLMVALTDEIFLHIVDWDGAQEWRNNLLETRVYDSYISGEKVFNNLDRLLKDRNPVYADLARLYLIALAIGFQGRYRNTKDDTRLERYKRELFTFIAQREPDKLYEQLFYNEDKHIFPDAYAFTIKESLSKRLPSLRKWYIILAVVIAGLLLSSHFWWMYLTNELHPLTAAILQGNLWGE